MGLVLHPDCSVDGLKCGFFCFGRQQINGKDFVGIEKCVLSGNMIPSCCVGGVWIVLYSRGLCWFL